jgi:hypothetical protein
MPQRISPAERFLAKVDMTGDCWTWQSAKNRKGYGEFFLSHNKVRKKIYAHRYAYELLVDPIPDGLVIDHLCRNPSCVRPSHLEPVTTRENVLRGTSPSAKNVDKTHCPQGHPYDEANTEYPMPGERRCITCRRAERRSYMARRRAQERAERAKAMPAA